MFGDCCFLFDDDDNKMKYKYFHNHQKPSVSLKHTAPYIGLNIIERKDFIFDTPSTAHSLQGLHMSNAFR